MTLRPFIAAAVAIAFLLSCSNQRKLGQNPRDHDPRWARIDSLSDIGQYATALERTDSMLLQAQASHDWRTEFRAWMYRARFQQNTGVEQQEILAAMEARAMDPPPPGEARRGWLSPLLHSVIAESWWNFYQQDRWTILERTNTSGDLEDPNTWTQRQFMEKVIGEYRASLEPSDSLKHIPVGELGELLISPSPPGRAGEGWNRLRPTLFDLLAHRALQAFLNTETRIAEPAWRFKLDDPRVFVLFEDFAFKPFAHRDSTAWEFQALRLYQALEELHLSDTKPDALVDITLARLAYVRERSTLANKDSLYLHALEILRTRLPKNDGWSEVTLAVARWHEEMGEKYDRLAGDAWKWEKKTARDLCDSAIARFPGSFGAVNAANLKARLEEPSLDIQCEEAVLPDAPIKLALTYKNVKKVWLRVVNDPVDINGITQGREDHDAWLTKQKPLKEWAVDLPADGDLNAHIVEVAADGLPFGRYALVVCDASTFAARKDLITYANAQATRLSMVERRDRNAFDLLVLDRWTGLPRVGVKATLFSDNQRGEGLVKMGEAVTNAEGRLAAKLFSANGRYKWTLETGADKWIAGDNYAWFGGYDATQDSIRTFLFTDRAIYRPGQEVMFKGILTVKRGKTTETKAEQKTTVRFFDVNGELVDSLNVITDAFGSFHGTFKAPSGALTGQMRIEEAHGAQWIQVEEYKRPTFEVVFDPIAGQPKLEENVSVTGLAKSYAGAPLDGAEVKWTVKRGARMPWWCGWGWRGLPWGRETEIASGTSSCDAQGKFTVTFLAQADRAFPADADPTFFYTVEASAVDITGETQSSSTSLNLGYRSIDIVIDMGDAIDRNTTDSIDVRAKNLNGQDVDVPMDITVIRISPLPAGEGRGGGIDPKDSRAVLPLRGRLWERPDRFLLSREQHTAQFPQDEYGNENDPLTWPTKGRVLDHPAHRVNGKRLSLTGVRDWDVGSYLIEVTAKDSSGREVKVRKHFTVYDTTIQNTGFINEPFHIEQIGISPLSLGEGPGVRAYSGPGVRAYSPGDKAILLLSTALPEAHILMEVERDGVIAVSRWFILKNGQQRVEIPVLESDRGGFFVHFVCVERGRAHNETMSIDVPWSNKELVLEWMSFRDKLQPGDDEEWRLKISGPKGEKVAAQLLTAMYDASLDHFVPHDWGMSVWPSNDSKLAWSRMEPFGANYGGELWKERRMIADTARTHPYLNLFGWTSGSGYRYMEGVRTVSFMALEAAPAREGNALATYQWDITSGSIDGRGKAKSTIPDDLQATPPSEQPTTSNEQPLRTDFRETAFFFPDLLTDRDGSVVLRFKTPDALTRWKVLGLAHTKDLKIGQFTKETITQKPLMVVPNLPRFLRAGDRITLTAKINVLPSVRPSGAEDRAEGLATLSLFDPFTNAVLNKAFGLQVKDQVFIASKGESAVVSWKVTVPEGVDAVSVRITAASKAGPHSTIVAADGEERVLPVLTDKVLVTESLPLWASKAGTKTFTLEKLKNNTSTTLRSQSLKLEYTPNPAWYAVQALPYLMEFPHECAEQVFSRYYANRLAAHIVSERPAIKKVFDEWRSSSLPTGEGRGGVNNIAEGRGGVDAFASNLEKNPELKNILLAETPWVVNARDDRERKQRIALLFDLERMGNEEASALKKLRDMQLPNGAWPWWSGMRESRWITQHIVAGLGHLEALNAADLQEDGEVQQMIRSAVQWLDDDVDRDYKRLQRELKKEDLANYRPGYTEIHYLYARSFFRRWPIDGAANSAVQFYKDRLAKEWLSYGLQEQAMIALLLNRFDEEVTAHLILKSIEQRATMSEELGMYWKDFSSGMDWWSFPTETHALMIEAFHEVANDEASVNALRTHLLKLKQTTDWKTTKATAEACYALLLTGDDWLEPTELPVIKVGSEELKGENTEAGTGYFEKTWSSSEITPAHAAVTVSTVSNRPSWGALHWQYFENMNKVTPHASPFSIRKQVMLTEQTDQGPRLVPLDETNKAEAPALQPGDLLTIRIELRTDRPVDYVHLKDLRAAGLEPTEAISGYKYQGGLGYYQSIRDASMNFFFDRIPAGTFVFEYTLRVTHIGDFSNGITTAMCMYAPEFSSHSEGLRLEVQE